MKAIIKHIYFVRGVKLANKYYGTRFGSYLFKVAIHKAAKIGINYKDLAVCFGYINQFINLSVVEGGTWYFQS